MGKVKCVSFAGWVAKISCKMKLRRCVHGEGREKEENGPKQRRERETSTGGVVKGEGEKGPRHYKNAPRALFSLFFCVCLKLFNI